MEAPGWIARQTMRDVTANPYTPLDGGRIVRHGPLAASTLAPDPVGWRMFHWLQRSLVADRSVVD